MSASVKELVEWSDHGTFIVGKRAFVYMPRWAYLLALGSFLGLGVLIGASS